MTITEILKNKDLSLEQIRNFLDKLPYSVKDFDPDKQVALVWHVEDVIIQAKDRHGIDIPEDDAREILDAIYFGHDATIGVNWDVIDVHIDDYAAELELNTNEGV